jgi:F-type H+-transporting ATPase subunit delta
LILKNREAAIAEVITNFRKLLDDHRGIIRGEVSSVVALSDSQMKNLKARLDRITGKNVIIIQRVDTRLLGGFVVQIEDKVYDTSLRHQLEMMRQNLVES